MKWIESAVIALAALALAVAIAAIQRSKESQRKIRDVEKRLRRLEGAEQDTIRELQNYLTRLETQLGELEIELSGKSSNSDTLKKYQISIQEFREKIKQIQESAKLTQAELLLDQKVARWLSENRFKLVDDVVVTVLSEYPHSKDLRRLFSEELACCLGMISQVIRRADPNYAELDAEQVWETFPKKAVPLPFYLIALKNVRDDVIPTRELPSQEEFLIKKYLDLLIRFGSTCN